MVAKAQRVSTSPVTSATACRLHNKIKCRHCEGGYEILDYTRPARTESMAHGHPSVRLTVTETMINSFSGLQPELMEQATGSQQ